LNATYRIIFTGLVLEEGGFLKHWVVLNENLLVDILCHLHTGTIKLMYTKVKMSH